MMLRGKRNSALFLMVFFLLSFFVLKVDFAQQVVQEEQNKLPQAEEDAEKIVPSPANIKESTGIYIFLAWMWIAIFVLIYILRLKIKEVDRLNNLRFLSVEKK